MMSAIMSPLFRVADYGIEEFNLYSLKCAWQFGLEPKGMEIEQEEK